LGLVALAAAGVTAWHPASGGAPRTVVALRRRGVEELGLVSALGKPQLLGGLGGASPPLPHVVLNATADIQELCDSVKASASMLLRISGWRIDLAPYQAVSYCTDGLGYTVKVEVEAGKDLQGRPEPAYLQLSIRNDTGPTLFTALMVESIHGLCASLPVLPPGASPEQLPEAPPPVGAAGAPAEQEIHASAEKSVEAAPLTAGIGTNSSTEKGGGAAQLAVKRGAISSVENSGEAAPLETAEAVPAKQGADSSARKGNGAPPAAEEAVAEHGGQSSETGEKGSEAEPLIMAEVPAKQGMNTSFVKSEKASPAAKATEEEAPAWQGTKSSAKKSDMMAP